MSQRLDAFQEEMNGWRSDLLLTPTKQPRPLLRNAIIALRRAPEWQGVLAYDEFALATMAMKPPPWLKSQDNAWTLQLWTDRDDTLTTDWLQQQGIGVPVTVTATAVEAVAKDASFHPVRDYLTGLAWDGTERVTGFAATHLGAEATVYHNDVSRRMFVAAVARIMRPGCKHDHMPILEAPQGAGKSKAIATLFQPWFTDDLAELGTKDASMQVRAAWGIEVAELSAMTRGEIERVKAFITRSVDRFRPSYGRRVIEVPRQSVFIGSTNASEYLKDETGGRRFWPIQCGTIDHSAIERDRDQLWAEAVALFNNGESWWLADAASVARAYEQQGIRYQDDPWQAEIAEYCASVSDASIGEILEALGVERARWTQADQNRVARCLRQLGWERYRVWTPAPPRPWRYRPASVPPSQSSHRPPGF
jgi:predicted P-loop ATPase